MISMLHHWAECVVRGTCSTNQKVFWIHGARNSRQHPFTAELKEIQNLLGKDALALETHVAYSQPMDGDQFNSKGRLNVAQLAEIVPCIDGADIYMCGTHGFIAEMEKGLVWEIGVPASQIHYETF
jgi:ferredoxin-NADP reductase